MAANMAANMVSKAVVPKAFGERLVNRSRNMVSKAVVPKAFEHVQSELVLPQKHFKFAYRGSRHCDARWTAFCVSMAGV